MNSTCSRFRTDVYKRQLLSETVEEAARRFVETRVTEGENLKADLQGKLNFMTSLVDFIEERSPRIMEEYRTKLEDKVKELLSNTTIDEGRIATEVTIFADKICVDEETVRLRSHIENTKAELAAGGSVGRKLDFIAQEMNREANTILSKANDLEISDKAIAPVSYTHLDVYKRQGGAVRRSRGDAGISRTYEQEHLVR